jgi:ATP-binding cassette subfamily F protein 2
METMDPSTFATRASLILTGLGFNKITIHKKTKDMSGGWRMRVALAKLSLSSLRCFFWTIQPLTWTWKPAWLEEYLKKWDRTLILVSHSMDFLNGVCTNMIDMRMKKLIYYGGNYDSYIKTRSEQEVNQMKAYTKQQDEITHIKNSLHRLGRTPTWSDKLSLARKSLIKWKPTGSSNL